jgi:hypothetical protein
MMQHVPFDPLREAASRLGNGAFTLKDGAMRPIATVIAVFAAACPFVCLGEMVEKPDENTLWVEDGVDIAVGKASSDASWNGAALDIASAEQGGFVVRSTNPERHGGGRYVKVDNAYPWLVFETTRVNHHAGYRQFAIHFADNNFGYGIGAVSQVPVGIWAHRPFVHKPEMAEGGKTQFLVMTVYHADVTLSSLKMVRRPDYYIDITSPAFAAKGKLEKGDTVVFTVCMATPAEDVTLRFFDSYTMPQLTLNGQTVFQLKPIDDTDKIWAAEIDVQSCEGASLPLGEPFVPGRLLVRATILGGGVKAPLWTCNHYPFEIQ